MQITSNQCTISQDLIATKQSISINTPREHILLCVRRHLDQTKHDIAQHGQTWYV
jgi:hypothetical protein